MNLEKFSMSAIVEKLVELGGDGKFEEQDWRIRRRLNWHHKAKSVVRHIISGARHIKPDEVDEIRIAHLKFCAESIEANRNENAKLFASMQSAIAAMQATDPEFYAPHVAAVSDVVLRLGNVAGDSRREN